MIRRDIPIQQFTMCVCHIYIKNIELKSGGGSGSSRSSNSTGIVIVAAVVVVVE